MLIRLFTEEDLSQILAIERISFAHPYDEEIFRYLWKRNPEGFIVACEDERVVGYALFGVDDDGEGALYSMAVYPSVRGKRYGEQLLEYSLNELSKRVKRIYLQVAVDNSIAIRMYLKQGFVKIKTYRGYYEDGKDAYLMVKKLG